MALQTVSSNVGFKANKIRKAASLKIGGEPLVGYLIYLNSRIDKETGKTMSSIGFLNVDGTTRTLVFPAGNLKYMVTDTLSGKNPTLNVGYYTEISRIADTKIKGMISTQYSVAQDNENVVDVNALPPFVARDDDDKSEKQLERERTQGGGAPVTVAAKKAGNIAANLKKLQESA